MGLLEQHRMFTSGAVCLFSKSPYLEKLFFFEGMGGGALTTEFFVITTLCPGGSVTSENDEVIACRSCRKESEREGEERGVK